jgi:Neocarzinostatin family
MTAVVAVVAAVLSGAGPASAAPALTVEPRTDLLDEQQVTVTGTGFRPGAQVAVLMCLAEDTTDAGCDFGTAKDGRVEDDGTFRLRYSVERVLDPKAYEPTDCVEAEQGCAVVAFDVASPGERVVVPVEFDPTVPLPHPLDISVRVRRVGFVRTTGQAVVEGTVACNRAGFAEVDVDLAQDAPDVIGSGHTFVRACGADASPWRVVVVAQDGNVFAPRRAAAVVRAGTASGDEFAEDLDVAYVDLSRR